MSSRSKMRARAIAWTLFPETTLESALAQLGFVQADPIRAPARAQDLILRQRVRDYRAGDLERLYPLLELEEDLLYAYGFLTRPTARLLQPRAGARRLSALDRKVLALVESAGGPLHPRELDAQLGRRRVVNAWGGYSQATKRSLEHLHYRGLLRVHGRERGVRRYELAEPRQAQLSAEQRLEQLTLTIANVLSPLPTRTLQRLVALLQRRIPASASPRARVQRLLAAGLLESDTLDGEPYVWSAAASAVDLERAERRVRLLAPFDPLVWDRQRFEQLWGWAYRFEAYTPVSKRVRGYYALPLLWGSAVIGWANARVVDQRLSVELGFATSRPKEPAFARELAREIAALERFLARHDQCAEGEPER